MLKEKNKSNHTPIPHVFGLPTYSLNPIFWVTVCMCEGEMTITATPSESPLLVFYFIKYLLVWKKKKKKQACGISCCTRMWLFCLSHWGAHHRNQSKSLMWAVNGMQTETGITGSFLVAKSKVGLNEVAISKESISRAVGPGLSYLNSTQ